MINNTSNLIRRSFIAIASVFFSILLYVGFRSMLSSDVIVSYSEFLNYTQQEGEITKLEVYSDSFKTHQVRVTTKHHGVFRTNVPPSLDHDIIKDVSKAADVSFINYKPVSIIDFIQFIFSCLFNGFLLLMVFSLIRNNLQSKSQGGMGIFPFSLSPKKADLKDKLQNVKFEDVAGIEGAKNEVMEVVDFLKHPENYNKLGGRVPKGILLAGPPGTGKTLLARAIAGESNVPMFFMSGAEFGEIFYGAGSKKVRSLFAEAQANTPCMIFIDEIETIGRKRGTLSSGINEDREQTLNQLLVEMDGFVINSGIIVIAATNRPEILDPALLRPGRFDRKVFIDLPSLQGREDILKIHMKKIIVGNDINFNVLSRRTSGFSGADLANLVNEAALLAAYQNAQSVCMIHFEEAFDKIILGGTRRSLLMSEEQKRLTAYHESGHALVSYFMEPNRKPYKVTIIPRGQALGVTMFLGEEEDMISISKEKAISTIITLMGGRASESIIFGDNKITAGAHDDIKQATKIARAMVTQWGLSEIVGPVNYDFENTILSDKTIKDIDKEVQTIITHAFAKASDIIKSRIHILQKMVDALMEYETLNAEQIETIFNENTISS